MKRFLLKVVGITLAGILVFIGAAFAVLYIFTPRTLAGIYDGLGGYGAAASLMYKEYRSSDKISDLDATCRYALKHGDDEKIALYLGYMTKRADFEDYCNADEGLSVGYYDFLCSEYVVSAYKTESDTDGVILIADALTKTYGKGSALHALAVAVAVNSDKATAAKVRSAVAARADKAEGEEKLAIESDIEHLDEFLRAE